MRTRLIPRFAVCILTALPALLAGCAGAPPPGQSTAEREFADSLREHGQAPNSVAPAAAVPRRDAAVSYANIDRYKEILARHVVRHNAAHTFTGPVPPLLPAIVVLRISVDHDGNITDMFVQRSIDDQASHVAMESMRRSGALPPPRNLLAARADALSYSETFLFNHDYRFQVRSLAPPQLPVE